MKVDPMPEVTSKIDPCPVSPFADLVGGRWKLAILYTLEHDGKARFNELVQRLGSITPTTLTRQLRELERDGFVTRTQFSEIPPRVEYEATELLATLVPVLDTITVWVENYFDRVETARAAAERDR
jgi:DNA-binding HxlR family transcriptional regulator